MPQWRTHTHQLQGCCTGDVLGLRWHYTACELALHEYCKSASSALHRCYLVLHWYCAGTALALYWGCTAGPLRRFLAPRWQYAARQLVLHGYHASTAMVLNWYCMGTALAVHCSAVVAMLKFAARNGDGGLRRPPRSPPCGPPTGVGHRTPGRARPWMGRRWDPGAGRCDVAVASSGSKANHRGAATATPRPSLPVDPQWGARILRRYIPPSLHGQHLRRTRDHAGHVVPETLGRGGAAEHALACPPERALVHRVRAPGLLH